mmetsp:Transcript_10943/g.31001  ORF Transcript_10943/g.31001 Transcript_10943/m.31001 type:complete len:257 (-) Transcript_10943:309-1079(-)
MLEGHDARTKDHNDTSADQGRGDAHLRRDTVPVHGDGVHVRARDEAAHQLPPGGQQKRGAPPMPAPLRHHPGMLPLHHDVSRAGLLAVGQGGRAAPPRLQPRLGAADVRPRGAHHPASGLCWRDPRGEADHLGAAHQAGHAHAARPNGAGAFEMPGSECVCGRSLRGGVHDERQLLGGQDLLLQRLRPHVRLSSGSRGSCCPEERGRSRRWREERHARMALVDPGRDRRHPDRPLPRRLHLRQGPEEGEGQEEEEG